MWLPRLAPAQQWTCGQSPLDRALALDQWERLAVIVEDAVGPVVRLDPAPWAPAQTYTRDLGVLLDGTMLACRPFAHRGLVEIPLLSRACADAGLSFVDIAADVCFDGGNFVVDHHERILLGLSPEVERDLGRSVAALRRITNRTLVGVPLAGGRWPHLDMTLCDLAGRGWLVYPPALSGFDIDNRVWQELFVGKPVLIVDPDDGERLACNAVVTGSTVIGPAISSPLCAQIERLGFDYLAVDVTELIKGGGGPHCLTLPFPA